MIDLLVDFLLLTLYVVLCCYMLLYVACYVLLCVVSGMVRNLLPRSAANLESPLLTSLYSSAFHFNKCHADLKVPSDPNLLFLSDGNDFSLYAR